MEKIYVKGLCCFLAIALFPLVALSWWRTIPLDEAVTDSDIIIVGTLRNISEENRGEIDYGAGELTVDEILRGNVEAGQKLDLRWENEALVICPRIRHEEHQNKQIIWLLKLRPDGKVAADNPGRYIALEKKEDVINLIRSPTKSKRVK